MNVITNNILFGIILSLLTFEFGLLISRKTKFPLFNPLLIAIITTILFLVIFNIDYKDYNRGAEFINMFLGPSTVILAVPLYKQLSLLKQNFVPIILGVLVGSITSILSVILLCIVFGLENVITISLIPKSVTTPIGIEISKTLGGLPSITVLSIVISGISGAVIGPSICKVFKIKNEVAIGIAIGTASHAVGTSKALELGETQGAMSSLSIGIAGLMTVVLAPIIYSLVSLFLF